MLDKEQEELCKLAIASFIPQTPDSSMSVKEIMEACIRHGFEEAHKPKPLDVSQALFHMSVGKFVHCDRGAYFFRWNNNRIEAVYGEVNIYGSAWQTIENSEYLNKILNENRIFLYTPEKGN